MAIDTTELERRIETARVAAKEFSKTIRREWRARVISVRLYGSFARGDATPESDVDIIVLVKRRRPRDRDRASDLGFRIGALKHEIVLMPMVFSRAEFERLLRHERAYALAIEQESVML